VKKMHYSHCYAQNPLIVMCLSINKLSMDEKIES
jgi:hypothetical protein